MCNDDFHHAARVRLTGLTEAYYEDYAGSVDELRSAIRGGFLYQGQISQHQGKRRGTPARGLPADRIHSFPAEPRPGGQLRRRIADSRPDQPGTSAGHDGALAAVPSNADVFPGSGIQPRRLPSSISRTLPARTRRAVAQGRINFLSQFPSLNTDEVRRALADPADRSTFERSKFDWTERERHERSYEFHEDLLKLAPRRPRLPAPAIRSNRSGGARRRLPRRSLFRRRRRSRLRSAPLGQLWPPVLLFAVACAAAGPAVAIAMGAFVDERERSLRSAEHARGRDRPTDGTSRRKPPWCCGPSGGEQAPSDNSHTR